jgi:nucleosome assembly protein 1-like 1
MYEEKRVKLEKHFIRLRAAYYAERREIVNKGVAGGDGSGDGGSGGIEQFWLMCLKNNPSLNTLVKDRDEECLKYLTDIRCVYPERGADAAFADVLADADTASDFNTFNLELHFRENPYFTNSVLVKKYLLKTLLMPVGQEPELLGCVGTDIAWKDGMNLMKRKETKRIRRKQGGKQQTRTVVKHVDCDSFFEWFQTPPALDEADNEQDYMKRCEAVEMDFEVAQIVKNDLIPNAVNWFTGDADDSDFNPDDFDDEEDDDEDFDEDEEGDGDSDEDGGEDPNYVNPFAPRANAGSSAPGSGGAPGGEEQQECKTQ